MIIVEKLLFGSVKIMSACLGWWGQKKMLIMFSQLQGGVGLEAKYLGTRCEFLAKYLELKISLKSLITTNNKTWSSESNSS